MYVFWGPIFHSTNKTHSDRNILAKVLGHTQQRPEKVELHQLTRWIDRAGGSVPAGFAVCQRSCSCNHPSVHPWLGLGFSIEHLPWREMFERNGWYGSNNNDQNIIGLMFEDENYYIPQTVRFSLVAFLKFYNFCNVHYIACFSGSCLKEILGFQFIFLCVHEDFRHNVKSKRILTTIFIVSSLIHAFILWVKLFVVGSHLSYLGSWAFIIPSFILKYKFFF